MKSVVFVKIRVFAPSTLLDRKSAQNDPQMVPNGDQNALKTHPKRAQNRHRKIDAKVMPK